MSMEFSVPHPLPLRHALVFYSPLGIPSSKTRIILLWETTQQDFEQTEPGNASCSAKQNGVMALEHDTLCSSHWEKCKCRIRRCLKMWEKNYEETASKCLLISFKSSCWTTGIHMCCKERYLPVSKFTFIFIISLTGEQCRHFWIWR